MPIPILSEIWLFDISIYQYFEENKFNISIYQYFEENKFSMKNTMKTSQSSTTWTLLSDAGFNLKVCQREKERLRRLAVVSNLDQIIFITHLRNHMLWKLLRKRDNYRCQFNWFQSPTSIERGLAQLTYPVTNALTKLYPWSIIKFGHNCEIWSKLWNLVETLNFGWNCEIRLNKWNTFHREITLSNL